MSWQQLWHIFTNSRVKKKNLKSKSTKITHLTVLFGWWKLAFGMWPITLYPLGGRSVQHIHQIHHQVNNDPFVLLNFGTFASSLLSWGSPNWIHLRLMNWLSSIVVECRSPIKWATSILIGWLTGSSLWCRAACRHWRAEVQHLWCRCRRSRFEAIGAWFFPICNKATYDNLPANQEFLITSTMIICICGFFISFWGSKSLIQNSRVNAAADRSKNTI